MLHNFFCIISPHSVVTESKPLSEISCKEFLLITTNLPSYTMRISPICMSIVFCSPTYKYILPLSFEFTIGISETIFNLYKGYPLISVKLPALIMFLLLKLII